MAELAKLLWELRGYDEHSTALLADKTAAANRCPGAATAGTICEFQHRLSLESASDRLAAFVRSALVWHIFMMRSMEGASTQLSGHFRTPHSRQDAHRLHLSKLCNSQSIAL